MIELRRRDFLIGAGAALTLSACNPNSLQKARGSVRVDQEINCEQKKGLQLQRIWNAAAVKLTSGIGSASGYIAYKDLALNDCQTQPSAKLGLYTIGHFYNYIKEHQAAVSIHVPILPRRELIPLPNYYPQEFKPSEELPGSDTSVFLPFHSDDEVCVQTLPLSPMVRQKNHPLIQENYYLATPDMSFGNWNFGRITEVTENTLRIENINAQTCLGYSGSPWIVCKEPTADMQMRPVLNQAGRAIVVAETQAILYPENTPPPACAWPMRANRVS